MYMLDWRSRIPHEDWQTYEKAGFGVTTPSGARSALILIDMQFRTLGHRQLPLGESMETEYPSSCGSWGWDALKSVVPVLSHARAQAMPVFHAYIPSGANGQRGVMGAKAPALMNTSVEAYEFPEQTAPTKGETLVPKIHASAFAGTALASQLIGQRIDSVVLVGCTTSGCVRASAVDASSLNFSCTVLEDCVYDRSELSHAVNLFDMSSKYANVLSSEQFLRDEYYEYTHA